MNSIRLIARAKINLGIDVVGKRADGYHELNMIMQTISLCDRILLKKVDKYPFRLICNLPWLPVDSGNLITRAVDFFQREYRLPGGLFVELRKSIPVGAGTAGGSSDCAAVIHGINALYGLELGMADLISIGKMFGADVPYCLIGGTVHAEGIGDILHRLPSLPRIPLVIAKPPFSLSSAEIFTKFDEVTVGMRPDIQAMIKAVSEKRIDRIAALSCNVLEPVCIQMHPEIAGIKEAMLAANALNAVMTGSGPSVFGYFRTRRDGMSAVRALKSQFPLMKEIYYTETVDAVN